MKQITKLDMRVFGLGIWLAMTAKDEETSNMYIQCVLSFLLLLQSGG